jgi:hypothetical protein
MIVQQLGTTSEETTGDDATSGGVNGNNDTGDASGDGDVDNKKDVVATAVAASAVSNKDDDDDDAAGGGMPDQQQGTKRVRLMFIVEELVRPGYSLDALSARGYFNPDRSKWDVQFCIGLKNIFSSVSSGYKSSRLEPKQPGVYYTKQKTELNTHPSAELNSNHAKRALASVYDVATKALHLTRTLRRSGMYKFLKPSDLIFAPGNEATGAPHQVMLRNIELSPDYGSKAFFGRTDPTMAASFMPLNHVAARQFATDQVGATDAGAPPDEAGRGEQLRVADSQSPHLFGCLGPYTSLVRDQYLLSLSAYLDFYCWKPFPCYARELPALPDANTAGNGLSQAELFNRGESGVSGGDEDSANTMSTNPTSQGDASDTTASLLQEGAATGNDIFFDFASNRRNMKYDSGGAYETNSSAR